jgi:hypothetical protein
MDGSAAVRGLGKEDISGLAIGVNGTLFLALEDGFKLNGVRGDENDVVVLIPLGDGTYAVQLYWDGSASGLRNVLDGLAIP